MPTNKKNASVEAIDYTPYKATLAFALLFVSIVAITRLTEAYSLIDRYDILKAQFQSAAIALGVLAVFGLALAVLVKQKFVRALGRLLCVVGVMNAVSALVLSRTWIAHKTSLYFLQAFVYCLYIIWLLYRAEFFIFSFVTCVAGFTFYTCSHGASVPMMLVLAVVLILAALIVKYAASHKGLLPFGKKQLRLFPANFSPAILLIVCALWMVCLILTVILGARFSYFCTFAALAFELIAAVYYTFQLK